MLYELNSIIDKAKPESPIVFPQDKLFYTINTPQSTQDFDFSKLENLGKYACKSKRIKGQLKSFLTYYIPLATQDTNKSSVMTLSTHSKNLKRIYNHTKGVSDGLLLLQNLGILNIYSDYIRFNSISNFARQFSFNYTPAQQLLESLKDVKPYYRKPKQPKQDLLLPESC